MSKPQKEEPTGVFVQIPRQFEGSGRSQLLENKEELVLNLKEMHMRQQSELVKEIRSMALDSKKIIDDITVIESDIDKYQGHIDEWIRKIEELGNNVGKIRSSRTPFRIKANNMSKLKEHLGREIKKNR